MKKLVVLVVFLSSFFNSYGINIDIKELEIKDQSLMTEINKEVNHSLNEVTNIIQEYLIFTNSSNGNAFLAFAQQIINCASYQQEVANTFYGNPRFSEAQVNEMALGAFMGCMGLL